MNYPGLLLEKKEHIAIVTLNAPAKLNALNAAMMSSIGQICDDLGKDDDTHVVILTGAGRGFCSGADMSDHFAQLASTSPPSKSRFEKLQVLGYPHAYAFPMLNKPVIAAINGVCAGGGFSLALSCDIRIASDTAKFVLSQVSRALVPDYGATFYLPLAVGMSNASRIIFTAEFVEAVEAMKMGIVSQVVPQNELMNVAFDLATRIAKQPPYSLELSKRLLWRNLIEQLMRQLDLETHAYQICNSTEDHRASVEAFLNKKPTPSYHGK